MAGPSEKHIDQQLRTFARQRRAACPSDFLLRPDVRQTLHQAAQARAAEIRPSPPQTEDPTSVDASVAAPPVRPSSSRSWRTLIWPKLSLAAGLTLLLALPLFFWMPKRSTELAATSQAEPAPAASPSPESVRSAPPSVAVFAPVTDTRSEPPPPPTVSRSMADAITVTPAEVTAPANVPAVVSQAKMEADNPDQTAAVNPAQTTEVADGALAAPTLAPVTPVPHAEATPAIAQEQRLAPPLPAIPKRPEVTVATTFTAQPLPPHIVVSPTVQPVAAAEVIGDALQGKIGAPTTAGAEDIRFSNTLNTVRFRRNFNSPPIPPILQSTFSIHPGQDELRIVDADGSVYVGSLGHAQPGPTPAAIQRRVFSVSGTHRSSQSSLVFTGEWLHPARNLPVHTDIPSAEQAERVRGKVQLPNQTTISVDALRQ